MAEKLTMKVLTRLSAQSAYEVCYEDKQYISKELVEKMEPLG